MSPQVYAFSGQPFQAALIFSSISILNQLRFPLMFLPMIIASLSDAQVSLGRLDRFMRQPDVEGYTEALLEDGAEERRGGGVSSAEPHPGVGVSVKGGTFFWEHPAARRTRLLLKAGTCCSTAGGLATLR